MADATMGQELRPGEERLPVGSAADPRASGWYGMAMLITTEASLFAYLLFGYFYAAVSSQSDWPPAGPPAAGYALANLVVLVASVAAVWLAETSLRRGEARNATAALFGALVLGLLFILIQVLDWRSQGQDITRGSYGAYYYVLTGVHLAHVAVGVLIIAALFAWTRMRLLGQRRPAPLSIGALYWYFVAAVEIPIFATLYVAPHLG
ncbi:MAG: cytochrome c oxidase subunit 3 [Hansschlegelia sp.]